MSEAPISIGRAATRGAAHVGGAHFFRIVLLLLSTILIARILTPEDFGVIAMAAPVTAFILMFQDLGLSHATIQAKSITSRQSDLLFWINLAVSGLLALLLLVSSPFVALFYGEPRAGYVTAASAVTALVSASALQHLALLNRELRFSTIAKIDAASAAMGFVVAVSLALIMRNYWALWIGGTAGVLTTAVGSWLASRWRPRFRFSLKGSGALLRFGGSLTGFSVVNFVSRNADNILIGRVWGASPLGLYDRSYRLMVFPIQAINSPLSKVMIPLLSRIREEPQAYRRLYLTCLRAITIATFPAIAVAAATSDRLIPLLLGDRWAAAAPIFYWLSLSAFFQPIGNSTGWIYISQGRGRDLLWVGTLSAIVTLIAFAIGVRWGAVGVAAAYFFSTGFRIPFLVAWTARGSPISAKDMYFATAPSLIAAAVSWLATRQLSSHLDTVPLIATALALSFALGLIANALSPGGRDAIRAGFRWRGETRWRS